MMFNKISIVGVGLIGGSIGMACRKKRIARQVVGIGRRRSSINKAKKLGAVDKTTLSLKKGIEESDLIIISAPVNIVVEKIKECARFAKKGAVIIDVTSIKADIVKQADKIIRNKQGISFVGTHPMAGSEESGVSVARSDLFKNSICIITPSKYTKNSTLTKAKRFWTALGARVEIMPASKHDLVVAQISHLPHLLAYSLCASVPVKGMHLAGGGFKDFTRIAKSNPKMWAEIFIQNKADILRARNIFEKNIKLLQSDIIKNEEARLLKRLTLAKRKRDSIG